MKKCNFQPSIFEPAKATMSGQSKTDKDDTLTPRPLVAPDLYGTWQSECKYIHHGSAKYKHSCALNIHLPTSPIILLLQEKENISIASPPATVSNQQSSMPHLVSCSVGKDGQIIAWTAFIGYKGIDGNISGSSMALELNMAEDCLREPESTYAISILVLNGETRFITHCPRSPDMKST